ncbi:hypothetical protein ACFT9I_02450 [Streptomyces sp. NPDC057137]
MAAEQVPQLVGVQAAVVERAVQRAVATTTGTSTFVPRPPS